ncbi:hypothetical protein GCM10018785_11960 [Streptomyces longispororuber]|uniref:Uncharacterized protein n=1 Tax=Streptomyces longispororuber TaxID=68230 RepID=A0A919DGV4_9ACTN|nr:hypothetical protein GCM10018785_11960 [Streptomyces longispororuber]
MSAYVPLAALLGLGISSGLLLVVRGWREPPKPASSPSVLRTARRQYGRRERGGRWLTASLAAGLLVGAVTGWVAGGLLAAMTTWTMPRLLDVGSAEWRPLLSPRAGPLTLSTASKAPNGKQEQPWPHATSSRADSTGTCTSRSG